MTGMQHACLSVCLSVCLSSCARSYLLSQGSLPLALYRGVNSHAKIGIKANTMPYVYTNPSRDADVANCDMIFVLSSKPPDVTEKRLLAVTKQAGSK